MKFAFRDSMLGAGLSLEEKIARAATLGLDGIEIIVGDNYREHDLWQPGGPQRVRQLAQRHGLAISSLSLGGWQKRDFRATEPGLREEGQRMLQESVQWCRQLGAPVILLPFFGGRPLTPEEIENPLLIRGFREAAPMAERMTVQLAIESTLDAASLQRLLDSIGSTFVGVYYDLANSTNEGYVPADEIRALNDHIHMIHLKDTEGQPLGQGRVDWPAAVAAIRDIGYDEWLVFETPAGDDPMESGRRNLAFARRAFGL
jgi:sugar phosphate isomerase/epimerase